MQWQCVRGMHDIMPSKSRVMRHIIREATEVSMLYGFEEISTPIMEYTNLYSRSLGDNSDIVMKVREFVRHEV